MFPRHHHKALIHPDALERLKFLDDVDGGGFNAYHDAISRPGSTFHVRVNTLKGSPEAIIERLRGQHPGWAMSRHAPIPEAIGIQVDGPHVVEPVGKSVLVDRFTAESVAMGAPVFAPGLKQPIDRFPEGSRVGILARFTTSWDMQQHEIHGGNGIARFNSNVMHEQSRGVVVETTESWYRTPSIQTWAEYAGGEIIDQNLPSMVAAHALAPVEGDVVLDVCCGAGGKTTHVAQLMNGRGSIVAVDRASVKVDRLRARAARMGISCIMPVVTRSERMKAVITATSADKILVDPPCSALGLRLKFCIDESFKDLENFRANQARIFGNVMESGLARQGTRIVYCTCTVTREENELLVVELVEKHGLTIVDPGIEIGNPGIVVDRLSRKEASRLRRFYPHVDDTIGFFIATLVVE